MPDKHDPVETLLIAFRERDRATLEDLARRGVTLEVRGTDGHTVLTRAALRGDTEAIPWILQAGAAVDTVDASGRTARMVAEDAGHGDAVRLLELAGARRPSAMASIRGLGAFDADDVSVLVRASPGDTAGALADHIGADRWQRDALGQEVSTAGRCYLVFRFLGHPWTVVRDAHTHPDRHLAAEDAQALSKVLACPALHLDHRPTQGVLAYRRYDAGQDTEWLDASGSDPAVWPAETGAEDAWDDDCWIDEDLPPPPKGHSTREPWDVDAIDDPQRFIDQRLRDAGAYAPSWGRLRGSVHRLEIAGLDAADFERLDFVGARAW